MRHALLALAVLMPVSAAARADVRPRPGAKLPEKPLPDESFKPGEDGTVPPKKVWIAYKGLKPREEPDNPSSPEVELKEPIQFMQPFPIADRGQDTVLLVRTNRKGDRVLEHLGWVPTKYIIEQPQALQNANKVFRKAMIVNSLQTQGTDKEFHSAISVRSAPRAGAEPTHDPFRLFSLFFVYKNADNHVLLGSNLEFDWRDKDDPRRVVLGWLPRSRVCLWNSHDALEWDRPSTLRGNGDGRRRFPGAILRDPADAHALLRKPRAEAGNAPLPLFSETFNSDGESVAQPPRTMRFPIVEEHEIFTDGKRQIKGKELARKVVGGNELICVGGKGGFVDAGGTEQVNQHEIDRLQEIAEKLKQQMSNTEIVFVIDDTQSMKKWFEVVADVFGEIVAAVDRQGRKVKLALTYYNDDEEGNKKPVVVGRLAPVGRVGKDLAKELRGHKYVKGGGPREMVFAGLMQGVDGAGFSPFARKVVIHIGDMGDKSDPKEIRHAREVAAYFKKGGDSAIEYIPIQVIDPETIANRTDAKAFRTQVQNILKELKQDEDNYVCLKLNEEDKVTDKHREKLRTVVLDRYRKMAEQAAKIDLDLTKLQRGEWDENTRIDAEVIRILTEVYHVDLDKMRQAKGFQIFEYGYVWRKSPAQPNLPQVHNVILVNGAELEHITKLLGRLTGKGKRTKVREVIRDLIDGQLGEIQDEVDRRKLKKLYDSGEITLDDVLQKAKGLKASSTLLKRKLKEIKDDRFTEAELLELQRKKLILEGILRGVKVHPVKKTVSSGGYEQKYWTIEGKAPQENRRFSMGSRLIKGEAEAQISVDFYWIDLNEEWP